MSIGRLNFSKQCQVKTVWYSTIRRIVTKIIYRGMSPVTGIAVTVAAPSTWNSLPADIRLCENILTFKCHLKTHLFKLT